MTAQGHPRTIFKRAIESGNLVIAEAVIREIGQVTLGGALALTALVAREDPMLDVGGIGRMEEQAIAFVHDLHSPEAPHLRPAFATLVVTSAAPR